MPETYLPTRELDLRNFALHLLDRISTAPGSYGLSPGEVAGFESLCLAFDSAFTLATQSWTRTTPTITAKNDAKRALVDGPNGIRQIVRIIQANPATTDADRSTLHLTVPDREPSPIRRPAAAPNVDIVATVGRTVRLRLSDADSITSGRKPRGVIGASIYTFIGPQAPAAVDAWRYEGSTTKRLVNVTFPPGTPPGSMIWVTARWLSRTLQAGPPADVRSIHIAGGIALSASRRGLSASRRGLAA